MYHLTLFFFFFFFLSVTDGLQFLCMSCTELLCVCQEFGDNNGTDGDDDAARGLRTVRGSRSSAVAGRHRHQTTGHVR